MKNARALSSSDQSTTGRDNYQVNNIFDTRGPLLTASGFRSEQIYLFGSGGSKVIESYRDV